MSKKLLFIEDDIVTGSIYNFHLTSAGYQVRLLEDGSKGLDAVASFRPDVMVLDLMLPKINGLEIIQRVRAQPELRKLPIIVFTNAFDRSIVKAALKAGADRCLIKAQTSCMQLLDAVAAVLPTDLPSAPPPPVAAPSTKPEVRPSAPIRQPPPDPRAEFLNNTPQALAQLRQLSQSLLQARTELARVPLVSGLFRITHALTAHAALAQTNSFAQLTSALEALLTELEGNPNKIDASTLRTVNQCVEFLGVLFSQASSPPPRESPAFKILAVDDDGICGKAVSTALERASLKPVVLTDPLAAYQLLKREPFNLIITDVNMPGMNGFELCEKLRALPAHAETPVLFVTSLDGFEARVLSAKSGGSDFIAKPFLSIELALKALIFVLRGQLKATSAAPSFQAFSPKSG
jgi:DNA-binding response OmpR family regulator